MQMLEAEEIRNFGIAVGHPPPIVNAQPEEAFGYNARPDIEYLSGLENLYETGKEGLPPSVRPILVRPEAALNSAIWKAAIPSLASTRPTVVQSFPIPVVARQNLQSHRFATLGGFHSHRDRLEARQLS